MNISTVCVKRKLFWSFFIYALENFITFPEINRTIEEYNMPLHSIISSNFIVVLSIKHSFHSIIVE